MFFVLKGQGRATCDGKTVDIAAGDSILVPPSGVHVIENTGHTRLYTLCIMVPNEDFAELIRSGIPVELDQRRSGRTGATRPTQQYNHVLGDRMGPYCRLSSKVTLRLTLPDSGNPAQPAIHLDRRCLLPLRGDGPFLGVAYAPALRTGHCLDGGVPPTPSGLRQPWLYRCDSGMCEAGVLQGETSICFAMKQQMDTPPCYGQPRCQKVAVRVGMYGFSYQGMTQLYAAETRPEPLKTIIPAMAGYDLYADKA